MTRTRCVFCAEKLFQTLSTFAKRCLWSSYQIFFEAKKLIFDCFQVGQLIGAKEYDIAKPDSERQTALHYAAFIGNPEVCRALIRHGSQVDPKDQDGFTPLHRACAADRNEAVDILIESGASADNRNKLWETPWHSAAAHGAIACLERLRPHTDNVHIQDKGWQDLYNR